MPSVAESLAKALKHHQAGDLQEAERLYRRVIRRDRGHADALHLLGVLAHQQRKSTDAVNYISRAIAANGTQAPYFSNLAAAQLALGESDKAVDSAQSAVRIAPQYAGGWYNLSMALEAQGQLQPAVDALKQALQLAPQFVEAHNNLGNLLMGQGALEESIDHFREAVRLQPGNAQFHYNLANALRKNGELEAAIVSYHETLRLSPQFADGYNNLGAIYKQLEDHEAAEQSFRKAISVKPDYGEAYGNLGATLLLLNRLDEAVEAIQTALQITTDNAELNYSLGKAFQFQGRSREALEYYRRALEIDARHARAHFGNGALMLQAGRIAEARTAYQQGLQFEKQHPTAWVELGKAHTLAGDAQEAVTCFRTATELDPESVEAHFQLGNTHLARGENKAAESAFKRVVALKADHASAWNNLGNVHSGRGDAREATACYRRAIEIEPDFAEAHSNAAELMRNVGLLDLAANHYEQAFDSKLGRRLRVMHATMLPPVYESKEDLLSWRGRFVERLDKLFEQGITLDPAKELAPNFFYLAYQGFEDRELLERASRLYRSSHEFRGRPRQGDKLRVGFISQHFRNHTIGSFMAGLIANLPRDRFHVSVCSHVAHQDRMGQFIQQKCDDYVVTSQQVPLAIERIEQQQLDVLFYADIGMDPFTYTMACSRLAPVQCVTWGHPITTGLPTIDHFISSELLEFDGSDDQYTENLVRLSTLPTYYYPPRSTEALKPRGHFGLSDTDHVYLCPQSLFKLHPDFDDVLAEILEQDARAVIVLIEGLHKHWTERVQERLGRSLRGNAVRVRFVSRLEHDDFLSLMAASDVMLDPLHFGGGNTSYQALALGTPIVTLPSPYLRGRVTTALYQKIGVRDCIADTREQYVELAVRLGGDPEFRRDVRDKILSANTVLFKDEEALSQVGAFLEQAVATQSRAA